jgi:hypothetical protein
VSENNLHPLRARALAYRRAALYDGEAVTAKARQVYRDSFSDGHSCTLCGSVSLPDGLSPAERQRRAGALRSMHYANLGLAASRSRTSKAADGPDGP